MQINQQETTESCEIFGIVGIIIQLLLGLLSFSVLVFKRYLQFPKRPWKIWAMDASKQVFSQLIAHFINVGVSIFISNHLLSDACYWYFITNILNNTLQVFLVYLFLKLLEHHYLKDRYPEYISGYYYDIIEYQESSDSVQTQQEESIIRTLEVSHKKKIIIVNYLAWVVQFVIWVTIVCIGKAIVFGVEVGFNKPLNIFAEILLGWVQPYPTLELVIVIMIVPVFMNGLSYWLQDNFIKKNDRQNSQNIMEAPLL